MSKLLEFKREFDKRHDFDAGDLNYLYKKYPKVVFSKIPLAWVINIDDMLCELPHTSVVEIRQDFGQPVFILKNQEEKDKYQSILDKFDKVLRLIDKDLHKLYGYL